MAPLRGQIRLTSLPPELLNQIAGLLSKKTLKSLRLSCRSLTSVATASLFKQVYIAASLPTLEAFTAVADDPVLSQYVHEVVYNASYYEPESADAEHHEAVFTSAVMAFKGEYEDSSLPEMEKRSRVSYCERLLEQEDIRNSGEDLARLTAGLKSMHNVRTITITDFHENVENHTIEHFPQFRPISEDEPAAGPEKWHCWEDDCNTDYRDHDHELLSPSPRPYNCFNVVLRAISLSKAQIQDLYILPLEEGAGVPWTIFKGMSPLCLTHTKNALENLRMLDLSLYLDEDRDGRMPFDAAAAFKSGAIGKVISGAENLEELRFWANNSSPDLDQALPMEAYLGTQTFRRLHTLCLGNMSVLEGSLVPFLKRHATLLRSLTLVGLIMDEYNFADCLDEMRNFLSLRSATLNSLEIFQNEDMSDQARESEYGDYLVHGGKNPLRKDSV